MSKGAVSKAAKYQVLGNIKAANQMKKQFGETKDLLNPFITAGRQMLPQLQEGATLAGFATNLDEIMNSDVLDPLRDKRLEAINAEFAKAGLTRSGARGQAIANDLTDFYLGS